LAHPPPVGADFPKAGRPGKSGESGY